MNTTDYLNKNLIENNKNQSNKVKKSTLKQIFVNYTKNK
jgi:hypothetical protein